MEMPVSPSLESFDRPSKALNILSFLLPPAGLLVYLALVGKLPRQALCAGLWAVRGTVTMAVLCVLVMVGGLAYEAISAALYTESPSTTVTLEAAPPRPN